MDPTSPVVQGTEPVAAPVPRGGGRNRVRSVAGRLPEEFGVVAALVILVALIGVFRPGFLAPSNLMQQVGGSAFIGMLALGMVFLLAIRDIDLSVGWMFNFSAVFAAKLMVFGLDPFLAALGGVAFGAVLGLTNGLLTVALRIPVIIVTLGTFSMFRGLSLVMNESRAVVPPDTKGPFFALFDIRLFGSLPIVAVVFLLLAVVLHLVLHHTRFGYRVQAIGSNPEAARLAGIPIARTRVAVLVLMGAVAGLSGVLFVGFREAIDPVTGGEYVLAVVAAAIIGGTPLSGGWGTVIGAVVGAVIIQVITSGILFFGIDAKWSFFVNGAVIIIAVALDQLLRRRRRSLAERTGDAV
jgi:ribose transport system permease protein